MYSFFSGARMAARWLNRWKQEDWEILEITKDSSQGSLETSRSKPYCEKSSFRSADMIVFLGLLNEKSEQESVEILARLESARLLFTFQPTSGGCSLDEIRNQLFARGFTYVHMEAPRFFAKDHLIFAMRPASRLKRSLTLSQKRELPQLSSIR